MKSLPAFPTSPNSQNKHHTGMTLRDYFAAKALPIAADFWLKHYYVMHPEASMTDLVDDMEEIACTAYELADAMLQERDAA